MKPPNKVKLIKGAVLRKKNSPFFTLKKRVLQTKCNTLLIFRGKRFEILHILLFVFGGEFVCSLDLIVVVVIFVLLFFDLSVDFDVDFH